jgi:hypothetical protein
MLVSLSIQATDVYSQHNLIGRLLYWDLNYITVLTSKEYVVDVHIDGTLRQKPDTPYETSVGGIHYSNKNCEGQAYLELDRHEQYPHASPNFGIVVYDLLHNRTFHAPKSEVVAVSFESFTTISAGKGSCNDREFGTIMRGIKLYQNDQAITGVPDSGYTKPITIHFGDVK